MLRKKIRDAGFTGVTVVNQAISNLTDTYGLVVTHRDLTARARQRTPSAIHVSVDDFMNSPRYDAILELLGHTNGAAGPSAESATTPTEPASADARPDDVLSLGSIVLTGAATTAEAAITEAGNLLVSAQAVDVSYVDAMHEREKSVSTYMGNGLAIPHGTNDAKSAIRRSGISFVRYPEPIDWNGKPAEFVVGIAGAGKDHMALLTRIAHVFLNNDEVERLRRASTPEEVRAVLSETR